MGSNEVDGLTLQEARRIAAQTGLKVREHLLERFSATEERYRGTIRDLTAQNRKMKEILSELRAEPFKRPLSHMHDPDDPEPVLVFDFNGTITPFDGFPLAGGNEDPFPKVKKWMDRWKSRDACLHVATASLWPEAKSEPGVYRARMALLDAYYKCYGLPIDFTIPKIGASVFYDDRMIPLPRDSAKTDWDEIGEMAEEALGKRFDLKDGKWVRKPKQRTGRAIENFLNYDDVPGDNPRGYSTPVIDVDLHRTLSLASSSLRVDVPKPGSLEALTQLYNAGYTVRLSCAGWNPATHDYNDWRSRLATMRQWALSYGIPYDEFVTKDHGDLYFDDKGFRHANWEDDLPALFDCLEEASKRQMNDAKGLDHSQDDDFTYTPEKLGAS